MAGSCYACEAIKKKDDDAIAVTVLAYAASKAPIVPMTSVLCAMHHAMYSDAYKMLTETRAIVRESTPPVTLRETTTYCMHGKRIAFRMTNPDGSGEMTYRRGCSDCGDIG